MKIANIFLKLLKTFKMQQNEINVQIKKNIKMLQKGIKIAINFCKY